MLVRLTIRSGTPIVEPARRIDVCDDADCNLWGLKVVLETERVGLDFVVNSNLVDHNQLRSRPCPSLVLEVGQRSWRRVGALGGNPY